MKLFLLFYASLIVYALGSWSAKADTKCDADCVRDSRIVAQWHADLDRRVRERREARCEDGRVLAAIDGKLWCIRLRFGVR
jgi:hypothetical protein